MNLSILSTEFVKVPVTATINGAAFNPTNDVVSLAFVAPGANPTSGDWKSGSWETANGTYYARALVGPTGGVIAPAAGTYQVWVKIADNPETVARSVGYLVIQ